MFLTSRGKLHFVALILFIAALILVTFLTFLQAEPARDPIERGKWIKLVKRQATSTKKPKPSTTTGKSTTSTTTATTSTTKGGKTSSTTRASKTTTTTKAGKTSTTFKTTFTPKKPPSTTKKSNTSTTTKGSTVSSNPSTTAKASTTTNLPKHTPLSASRRRELQKIERESIDYILAGLSNWAKVLEVTKGKSLNQRRAGKVIYNIETEIKDLLTKSGYNHLMRVFKTNMNENTKEH